MKKKNKVGMLASVLALGAIATACTPHEDSSDTGTSSDTSVSSVAEKFAISIDAGEGATVKGLPASAAEGESVSFTVELAAEKELTYITIDGENTLDAVNGVYTFTMPKKALTVKAVTDDKRYNITVNQIAGATVALSSTHAKKGDKITVQVAIVDSTKSGATVTAGNEAVVLTAVTGEANKNTYSGEFTCPGQDVTVTVSLTDAPVADTYAISDDSTDGSVIVGAPSVAAAGETITFSTALEEGVEYTDDTPTVKKADGTTIDVTPADDGKSWSFVMPAEAVTISRGTTASIFKITKDSASASNITITLPEYGTYGQTVTVATTPTNYYEIDTVYLDGVALSGNTFTMPSHAVTVKVTEKTRTLPITLTDSANFTLKAYHLVSGKYVETTTAQYNEDIYFKAIKKDGASESASVKNITYQTKTGTSAYTITSTNSDGYYSKAYSSDFAYGIVASVVENVKVLDESNPLVGTSAGAYVYQYPSSYSGRSEKVNTDTFKADIYGNYSNYIGSDEITTVDNENKTFTTNDGYNGKWFDSGFFYITKGASFYSNNIYFYLSGSSSVTAEHIATKYVGTSYSDYLTNFIISLKSSDKSVFALVKKENGKEPVVTLLSDFAFDKGSSLKESGAIFHATVDGEKKYWTNTKSSSSKNGYLLTDYTLGDTGTYTGDLGSVTLDGLVTATIDKDGSTSKATYEKNGNYLFLSLADGTKKYLSISDSTYSELTDYSTGTWNGYYANCYSQSGSQTITSSNVYKTQILDNFTGIYRSNDAANLTLDATGKVSKIGARSVYLSEDKKLMYANDEAFMSTDSSVTNFEYLTDGSSKDSKAGFVAVLYSTSGTDKTHYAMYHKANGDVLFGTIKDNVVVTDTETTTFTFIAEDNTEFPMKKSNGVLVPSDGLQGTYTESGQAGLGNLVLDGVGGGSLGSNQITYTSSDSSTIVVVDETAAKQYTITLSAQTYTVSKTEDYSFNPVAAGNAYSGNIKWDNGDGEDSYSTYSSTMTFGDNASVTWAGTGWSSGYPASKTATYTYSGSELVVTFTLAAKTTTTVAFVYDSANKTFTPKADTVLESNGYHTLFSTTNAFTLA